MGQEWVRGAGALCLARVGCACACGCGGGTRSPGRQMHSPHHLFLQRGTG